MGLPISKRWRVAEMMEILRAESKPELKVEAKRLWGWVRCHPMLAVGALVLVTLIFAPNQPKSSYPADSVAEEPPLFI